MKIILLSCALALVSLSQASGTYSFRSGNGSIGGTDGSIQYTVINNGDPLTLADFNNAIRQNGDRANVISPYGAWKAALDEDSAAQWISTRPNTDSDSALYAYKLSIPETFAHATLHLDFIVDDTLGNFGTLDAGVYVNGHAIGGTINGTTPTTGVIGGGHDYETHFDSDDIASFLYDGDNNIEFDVINGGGPGGFVFSATIGQPAGAVPEPASFAVLGVGALALLRRRRQA